MSGTEHWDYLDKLVTDSYRKEIEFEENVWRTLPFFAAALGLEIAALGQFRSELAALSGFVAPIAFGLALVWAGLVIATLGLLARAIWPADFVYAGNETDFVNFAERLEELTAAGQLDPKADALPTGADRRIREELRRAMLWQIANCTVNNRTINKARERAREMAGRIVLASVLAVLILALFISLAPLYS